MPPDADRDIAELYAVPPKEFVRARNAKATARSYCWEELSAATEAELCAVKPQHVLA